MAGRPGSVIGTSGGAFRQDIGAAGCIDVPGERRTSTCAVVLDGGRARADGKSNARLRRRVGAVRGMVPYTFRGTVKGFSAPAKGNNSLLEDARSEAFLRAFWPPSRRLQAVSPSPQLPAGSGSGFWVNSQSFASAHPSNATGGGSANETYISLRVFSLPGRAAANTDSSSAVLLPGAGVDVPVQ